VTYNTMSLISGWWPSVCVRKLR